MIVCCERKQLKLEWIQPPWNQSQGLKSHWCDTPSGSIGFPFWTLGDHSVQAPALKQGRWSGTGLRPWMADRSQKSSRINEKRECLLKQHMALPQPSLPSWPCMHTQMFRLKLCLCWIQMGGGDNAANSLIQDNLFCESGGCGMPQNSDAASKATRPSLDKLFLIEALFSKIYHLPKQQVLQHPLAVS